METDHGPTTESRNFRAATFDPRGARPTRDLDPGRSRPSIAAAVGLLLVALVIVPARAGGPCATTGGSNAIASAAAGLAPGEWCEIATDDITLADTSCYSPAQYSVLQWSMSMVWDSANGELRHVGESEGRHCENHFKYVAATNSWETDLAVPGPANRTGHSYDHNAIRTGTATSYYRLYNGTDIFSYNPSTDSWSATAIPGTFSSSRDICYGIEWNESRSTLQFFDAARKQLYEWDGASTWSSVATGLSGSVYCPWMEYNPVDEVMCFGGPTNMYCSTSDGTTTAKAGPGFSFDESSDDIVADPVTGDLVAFDEASNRWVRYVYANNAWSTIGYSMPPVSGWWTVTAPVPDYGVIAILDQSNSNQVADLYIYRHADGGAPDTQAPTAPTGLAGVPGAMAEVTLTWVPSTDDRGVTGYRVRRDGALLATTPQTTYVDFTSQPSSTYTYNVTAIDAAGNESGPSNDAVVDVPEFEVPPPPDGMSVR